MTIGDFRFDDPSGPRGATGATGPTGATGATGATGTTGAAGATLIALSGSLTDSNLTGVTPLAMADILPSTLAASSKYGGHFTAAVLFRKTATPQSNSHVYFDTGVTITTDAGSVATFAFHLPTGMTAPYCDTSFLDAALEGCTASLAVATGGLRITATGIATNCTVCADWEISALKKVA
jgi:hypothetical protein